MTIEMRLTRKRAGGWRRGGESQGEKSGGKFLVLEIDIASNGSVGLAARDVR